LDKEGRGRDLRSASDAQQRKEVGLSLLSAQWPFKKKKGKILYSLSPGERLSLLSLCNGEKKKKKKEKRRRSALKSIRSRGASEKKKREHKSRYNH